LKQIINVFNKYNKSVAAVEEIPEEKLYRYGVIKGKKVENSVYLIEDVVEKPPLGKEPSNLAILGRYVFTPEIFGCIEEVEAKVKGEILLADALNLLRRKQEIYAYVFKGKRYDIGDKCGWIKATVELSLQRDDLKDELGRMFKEMFTF